MCLNLRPDNTQINARAAYDPSRYSWFEQFNKLHYKHRMVKHWMKKYFISFKRSIHLSLVCTNNHCLSRIIIFQPQINSEGCFTSSYLKYLYCLYCTEMIHCHRVLYQYFKFLSQSCLWLFSDRSRNFGRGFQLVTKIPVQLELKTKKRSSPAVWVISHYHSF